MSVLKTAWANLQDGLGNRFSWSHVKAIFYNYAEQKLLSTKLDEMDALIDEKIAKAMMSNVQVNDQTKVPTSALAYSMNESITKLNSDLNSKYSLNKLYPFSGTYQFDSEGKVTLTFSRPLAHQYLAVLTSGGISVSLEETTVNGTKLVNSNYANKSQYIAGIIYCVY